METDKEGANARAAVYTRISKDLSLEGLGVARQLKDCRALAARKQWQIVEEFEDNDISATGGKTRPDYVRLKALMENGAVDVVVVYAADRLHRNNRELEDWIMLAKTTGINIHSVTSGRIDLSTPDGLTMARVITAFAAGEVAKTTMRLLRKNEELAEAGAWPGRECYGYTADARVVPEEAAVIREMAARVLHGEGLNAIARDLTAKGILTAHGAAWRAASIRNILKAPRIAGLRVHRGKIAAKGQWDGIVSEATSAMLRARFAPGRTPGTRGGPRKHLLTGLLVCSKCRTGMVKSINGRSKKPSYRCPKNVGAVACGGTTIVAAETEAWLAEAAFEFQDARVVDQRATSGEWVEKMGALDAKLEELAADYYGEALITRPAYLAGLAAVERAKAALPVPIVRPRELTTGAMLRDAWGGMSVSVQRAVLDDIFVRVIVMPRRQVTGPKSFDSGRLDPEWRL